LAISGEMVEVYGDGSQTRDFIYVDDLVDAVIKAATVGQIGGETFQVATAMETSLNELIDVLHFSLARKGLTLVSRNGLKRLGDVSRNYSDTSKALKYLDWRATTALDTGVDRTVDWFIPDYQGLGGK